jgi:hypothetical protein
MNFTQTSDPVQNPSFPLNARPTIDRALDNIYALFGKGTTVLPLQPGADPSKPAWSVTSFADSNKPEHQAELRKSSLAVQLGAQSSHLHAIQFERQADYEAFVVSNPRLGKTLAIQCEQGAAMFIRTLDPMPPSLTSDSCAWLSEGTAIVVFNRQNPGAIKILSPYPPVELRATEISWNAELLLRFKQYLAAVTYGDPFTRDKKGNWSVNAMYWAEWFRTTAAITYQAAAQQFIRRQQDGSFHPITETAVGQALLEFIVKWRGNIPAACVSETSIRKCVRALKIIAADPDEQAAGADHLESFLAENVEPCDGSDVTSEELYVCYRAWSKARNVIPLAERQFLVALRGCIAKLFGVGKNHCVEREGSERRGYSGVRIKEVEVA